MAVSRRTHSVICAVRICISNAAGRRVEAAAVAKQQRLETCCVAHETDTHTLVGVVRWNPNDVPVVSGHRDVTMSVWQSAIDNSRTCTRDFLARIWDAPRPFKGQRCQLVTLGHPGLTYIFNFWHSGTLALSPERQSARMSEIKKCRLDLDGTEHFEM